MRAIRYSVLMAVLIAVLLASHDARADRYQDAKIALEAWLELFVAGEVQKAVELASTNETLQFIESDGSIKWSKLTPQLRKIALDSMSGGLKGYEIAEISLFGDRLARLRYFLVNDDAAQLMMWTFSIQNMGDRWVLINIQYDSGKNLLRKLGLAG